MAASTTTRPGTTSGIVKRLPRVEHPLSRLGDACQLHVQGLASQSGPVRPATSGAALATMPSINESGGATDGSSSVLPPLSRKLAVPEIQQGLPDIRNGSRAVSRRPQTQSDQRPQLTPEDVIALLAEKFRSGFFYQINYNFKAFDATGKGSVSREALFRILSNLFPRLTNPVFRRLLQILGLDKKLAVSFEDFYSHFHRRSFHQPKWLDPVSRHGPRFLTAFQVHQQLAGKVQERFVTMGEMFPSGKTNGIVVKPELRNMLNQLSLRIDDDEFAKLWRRYDTEDRGIIYVEKLMGKLGLKLKKSKSQRKGMVLAVQSSPKKRKRIQEQDNGGIDVTKVEEILRHQFNDGFLKLRSAFKRIDRSGIGKISREEFRSALGQFGIQLTVQEADILLRRCGIPGHGQSGSFSLFFFDDFIHRFMDRGEGSVSSAILTDPGHEFNKQPVKPSAITASSAESSLMKLLQGDFLSLLGTFQAMDIKDTGAVSQRDFKAALETKLKEPLTNPDFLTLIKNVKMTVDGLILYGDFLAKFNGGTAMSGVAMAKEDESEGQADVELEGRSVEEIESYIKGVLKPHYGKLGHAFEEIDESNLEHFNEIMLWEFFHKFQIQITKPEMARLWTRFIKNANGTLDYPEFLRHFDFKSKSAGVTKRQRVAKKWTDDHCFQRSKTLHRSEDMVELKLKAKLRLFYPLVRKRFAALDSGFTGLVDRGVFHEVMKNLVPDLTLDEMDLLASRFDPFKDGRVSYVAFLEPFQPSGQTYRVGNNMGVILSHKERDVTEELQPVPAIPKNPTKGVPGLVIDFRNQLLAKWKSLRRSFQKLDREGTGLLSREELRVALKLCDVDVSDEDFEHVAEEFKTEKGFISYRDFLNAVMEF
eukprot:m.155929 g.155929  ORF g.155929 m.155929 type:complete len:874 (+) comp38682_c0_seq7:229-2850(+)